MEKLIELSNTLMLSCYLSSAGDWKQKMERLARDYRWAYGAGIVLNMAGAARLELNYCIPVRSQQGDRWVVLTVIFYLGGNMWECLNV